MTFTHLIHKLAYLDALLKKQCTGSPKELSRKLKISRAYWFKLKTELEENFDLKIEYNAQKQSYRYAEPTDFKFGFFKHPTPDKDKHSL